MSAAYKRSREENSDILPYGSDSDSRSHNGRDIRRKEENQRDWRDEHLKKQAISSSRRPNQSNEYQKPSYRDDRDRERDRDRDRRQHKPASDRRDKDRRDDDRYRRDREGRYSRRDTPYERSDSQRSRDRREDSRDRNRDPSRVSSRRASRSASIPISVISGPKEEGEISPHLSQLAINSPAHPAFPNSASATPGPISHDMKPDSQPKRELPIEDTDMAEDEPSLEEITAARRAKRLAILAKYQSSSAAPSAPSTPGASQLDGFQREIERTEGGNPPSAAATPAIVPIVAPSNSVVQNGGSGPSHRPAEVTKPGSAEASPPVINEPTADFSLSKGGEDPSQQQLDVLVKTPMGQDDEPQVSAADYDPNFDRREDEERRTRVTQQKPGMENGPAEDGNGDQGEDIDDAEEDDDLDDMFAISDKPKKEKKKRTTGNKLPLTTAITADTASDPEGYYQIILGEALDGGRYQVFSTLGKGMFSAVVRARVVSGEKSEIGKEVAIKIVRSQESMYKAGLKEAQILHKLAAADPEDKKHIVRLERTFEHRGHLCLVFESMSMNLREVVKRFGKDVGLNINAVRAYAHQMFLALSLMKKCNIMHADIKPDNILVNESKAVLKLCDLGSASDVSENDITPYLVSRFYRAPEIILGLPYDTALDMWSIGCTLYELYTGKILFPGRTNNHMLLLMMELRGRFNSKMLKKSKFAELHFGENGSFLYVETDKITGKDVQRAMFINNPTRDLRSRLVPSSMAKRNDDESKMVFAFVDLLDKCLNLDPAKRMTPKDALMHPFIRG